MFSYLLNSKYGLIIGSVVGLFLSIYAFHFWCEFHDAGNDIMELGGIYGVVFTVCVLFFLSAAISGALIEAVLVKKLISSVNYFSLHKVGSIIGCLFGGLCTSFLLLSVGILMGYFLGVFLTSFLNEKYQLIGISLGITVVSTILVLSGSLIGLLLGAFSDSITRSVLRIGGAVH